MKIKAADAWKLAPEPGGKAKGEGILVFQPDTGVADHVELEAGMIGTNLAYDFIENKKGAVDPMNYSGNPGHGTGTASVVASRASRHDRRRRAARNARSAARRHQRNRIRSRPRRGGGRIRAAQRRQCHHDEPRWGLEQRVARRDQARHPGRGDRRGRGGQLRRVGRLAGAL